jgi:hypothetical protein
MEPEVKPTKIIDLGTPGMERCGRGSEVIIKMPVIEGICVY